MITDVVKRKAIPSSEHVSIQQVAVNLGNSIFLTHYFKLNLLCGVVVWLQTQRYRVQFPELQDFLSRSGSGAGSTQPRGDAAGA
jgi:hypothetical protein